MGFDASVELVKDGAQAEVALEGAKALFDANEVDVVAPEFGGVFAGEVAAKQILAFVAAGGSKFLPVQLDAEGFGGDSLSGCGKVKGDEPVGVAPGFLLAGSDGE